MTIIQADAPHSPVSESLARAFQPFRIWLVGGSLRDAVLGTRAQDSDFATDAPPEESERIMREWGEEFWNPGQGYGTVCAMKDGVRVEVTTLREEVYSPDSRKPETVAFSNDIWKDLNRRDFRINAMAYEVMPGGKGDLYILDGTGLDFKNKELNTPGDPVKSFTDDPLRIIRAARFVAQLPGFTVSWPVFQAMGTVGPQLEKVARERITMELDKLLVSENAYAGTALLSYAGVPILEDEVPWPSMGKLQPNLETRWAAWLLYRGPENARKVLLGLKHNSHIVSRVPKIVALCERFASRDDWASADVRRFVWEAGDLFKPVMDIMTKLQAPGSEIRVGEFSRVWSKLWASGELENLKQPLTGQDVMDALNIAQGPMVGRVLKWLQDYALEHGPLTAEAAKALMTDDGRWWHP